MYFRHERYHERYLKRKIYKNTIYQFVGLAEKPGMHFLVPLKFSKKYFEIIKINLFENVIPGGVAEVCEQFLESRFESLLEHLQRTNEIITKRDEKAFQRRCQDLNQRLRKTKIDREKVIF